MKVWEAGGGAGSLLSGGLHDNGGRYTLLSKQ